MRTFSRSRPPASKLSVMRTLVCLIGLWMTAVAQPVFDPIRAEPDLDAARSASGIDLNAVGTNLWARAVPGTADLLRVRAAVDKTEYRRGEPVHLFVYLHNEADRAVFLPKAEDLLMLRVGVLDGSGNPLPLTPAGEWLASLPAPEFMGRKHLGPNRVRMLHVDVTEVADLSRPGEYIVMPGAVFFSIPSPDLPGSAQFPGIRFKVTGEEFRGSGKPTKSHLQYRHEEHLRNATGAPRRLTEVEAELVAQTEAAHRATDAQFEAAMKAAAAGHALPVESIAPAAAATIATPAAPESPLNGAGPEPAGPRGNRRLVLVAVGLGLAMGALWLLVLRPGSRG